MLLININTLIDDLIDTFIESTLFEVFEWLLSYFRRMYLLILIPERFVSCSYYSRVDFEAYWSVHSKQMKKINSKTQK